MEMELLDGPQRTLIAFKEPQVCPLCGRFTALFISQWGRTRCGLCPEKGADGYPTSYGR